MSREPSEQRTKSLVEAEWIESFGWLIRLRWLAGAGVLLITLLIGPLLGIQVPVQPLFIIGAAILSYNLLFFLIERNLKEKPVSSRSLPQSGPLAGCFRLAGDDPPDPFFWRH